MNLGTVSECRSFVVIARDPMFIITALIFESGSLTGERDFHSTSGLANNAHAATRSKT